MGGSLQTMRVQELVLVKTGNHIRANVFTKAKNAFASLFGGVGPSFATSFV